MPCSSACRGARHPTGCHILVDRLKHRDYAQGMEFAVEIDALGLLCPLPVLRARKALASMEAGAVLRIEADDPMAAIDLPHFCAEAGYDVLLAQPPVFVIKA